MEKTASSLKIWNKCWGPEGVSQVSAAERYPPYNWSLLPLLLYYSLPGLEGKILWFSFHVQCWMFLDCHSLLFSLLTLKQRAKIKHKVQRMFMLEIPWSCRGMSDMWTCMPQKSMRCESWRTGRLMCDGKDLIVLLVPHSCLEADFVTTKRLPAGICLVRS